MLATFTLGSAALYTFLFLSEVRDDDALVRSWFTLFEQCRASIETREPFYMLNLLPSGASPDPTKIIGATRTKMWSPLSSAGAFALLEREQDVATGTIRSCEIVQSDWHKTLSRPDVQRLTYAFMEQREALRADGSHLEWDPSPLAGFISAGFKSANSQPFWLHRRFRDVCQGRRRRLHVDGWRTGRELSRWPLTHRRQVALTIDLRYRHSRNQTSSKSTMIAPFTVSPGLLPAKKSFPLQPRSHLANSVSSPGRSMHRSSTSSPSLIVIKPALDTMAVNPIRSPTYTHD